MTFLGRRPALVALGLVAVLASSCASDRSRGGTIVISTAGEPDILFPPVARQSASREVTDLVFDKLAVIGPELNTLGDAGWTPRLARSWNWSADSLAVTFHLDPRARWHDSVPVRSADIAFAYSVYTDPVIGSFDGRNMAEIIDSLQVVDSLTFTVWYREPRPERFYTLVYWLVPLPEHLLASIPRDSLATSPFARAPVGNGPFRFVQWIPRQRYEIAANDDYYGGRARLDRVIWSVVPEGQTAVQRVFAGEADFIGTTLSPAEAGEISQHADVRSVHLGSSQYIYLLFSHRDRSTGRPHPLLGDRELRRALTMAIDRDAVSRNILDSLGRISLGPFARVQWSADTALRQLPFDRDAAARTLDSLGWIAGDDGMRSRGGRPLSFNVMVSASSVPRQRLATLIQEQLRAVGVRLEIELLEGPTLGARASEGRFDAVLMTLAPAPSPAGLRQAWSSAALSMANNLNLGRYTNPVVDALIDSAINAPAIPAARTYYSAAYQYLLDDAPAVWLVEPIVVGAANRRLVLPDMPADAWWRSIPEWRVTGERATAAADTASDSP